MKRLIEYFVRSPKQLFLVDSIGALITGCIVGVIIKNNFELFGVPPFVAGYLSIIAFCFSLYSSCCYFLVTTAWKQTLRIIAIANTCYCCLTLLVLWQYQNQITNVTFFHFSAEIVVVSVLVTIEFIVATKLSVKK